MAYIVVGVLVWVIAGLAIAITIGRAIRIAEAEERRAPRLSLRPSVVNTATRA